MTDRMKARVGSGFQFSTRVNKETQQVDIWACYHPEVSS